MKKLIPISVIVLLIVTLPFFSFRDTASGEKALEKVTQQFLEGMENFKVSIDEYLEAAQAMENDDASIEELRELHLNTRLQFKKIEFLLEYFDHSGIKRLVNGPPLPFVEPKVPEVHVIQPEGLQVLDEMVFTENPFDEKAEIVRLVGELSRNFKKIQAYQKRLNLTHRHIFEAARLELIRIYTLGLTGFDTPGSGNALPEAAVAMNSLNEAMINYLPLIKEKRIGLAFGISGYFDISAGFFKEYENFDEFDRLQYLQKVVNPLYSFIYRGQRELGIETLYEVNDLPIPTNYHAENIFGNDFFNNNYYSNLNLEEDVMEKRVALGKILFFDPILSSNNKRSCASCHHPDKAFTDGLAKSLGYNAEDHINRNAPTLINALYSERYFYDLREPRLERQIKHVVMDSMEFATDFNVITNKLKQSKEYVQLFKDAYKDQPQYSLTNWSLSDALAAYVSTLTSFNSPFDKYVREEDSRISEAAKRGFNLFMGKATCGTCHFAPTFNGTVPPIFDESETEVLGVPADANAENPMIDPDLGRYESKRPIDEADIYLHSFKTTTVRNVALTAPYMHNGIYQTLEEVVDFYNKGGGIGLGIDVPNQTLPPNELNLNEHEVSDLVAFMEALTDTTGFTAIPAELPVFENNPEWNKRKVGGDY